MTGRTSARRLALGAAGVLLAACGGSAGDEGMRVSSALVSAPGGGAPGALYLRIENATGRADWLVRAGTPAASRATLHRQMDHGGVTMMMPADSIAVAAGATVTLQPGGSHVMLEFRTRPLAEGDTVPATLWFRRAGAVEVRAVVAGPGEIARRLGTAGPADHHGHGGGS